MTVRTFKQQGQSYGSTPTSIVAKIDGVEVYNGVVSTLDIPPPLSPNSVDNNVDLFTWEAPLPTTWEAAVNSNSEQLMEITVLGNNLYLGKTWANHSGSDPEEFYSKIDPDENGIIDPLTNVIINGEPQIINRRPGSDGQWRWTIPAGATFTASVDLFSDMPVDPPDLPPSA